MAVGTNGAKLSVYLDKDLWKDVDLNSSKLGMSPNDFVRLALRKYMDNEAVIEVEKLQVFNFRMFKYLANKLSHLEMLSAIAKEDLDEKIPSVDFDGKLNELKHFNGKVIDDMFEESL